MSEPQPFVVDEAPSVDDIVSASGRLGAVDFAARPRPTVVPDEVEADDPAEQVALTRLLVAAARQEPEPPVTPVPPHRGVAEVAEAVAARMRAVGEAHERHVEAIELEAARRVELLTAQAELDAELIRLHARREAHAIVSEARRRTGEYGPVPDEAEQLEEIGETFSRFAEDIETTVRSIGPVPEPPDSLWPR